MTNFEFADSLREDLFVDKNEYHYGNTWVGETKFCSNSENYPFIFKGQPLRGNPFSMIYCQSLSQLGGRLLTVKKIKEVMNSSRYPIIFKIKGIHYYIGKGYLSILHSLSAEPRILFIACINGNTNPTDLSQVKFFVDRSVFKNETYKPILPAIKDFMNNHIGDVILTNDISQYVGESIKIPTGLSILEMERYTKDVIVECLVDTLNGNKILELE